jgi:PAS domain S-box-containing protein
MSFSEHVVPRTDAKTDVLGDRNHLIQIGMAAVGLTLLFFGVLRLVVALQTGLPTPWWGNAAGLVAMTALWAWYRRRPQTRSSGALHGTALVATMTLLIPVAYGLTSSIWWLALVGLGSVLLGRRQEAKIWGVTIPLVMVASVIAEPYVRIQGAAGEPPLEAALAKIVFAVTLIGIAVGFRRIAGQRASQLHDSEAELRKLKDAFEARALSVEGLAIQRLQALLGLNQMTGATLKEITDFALEEAVRLTQSTIGYLAFLDQDESVLTMHSWSKSAMAECAVSDKPIVYPVASTGLWGEAVRQRRAVITNDYSAANPFKKGCPQGHVAVKSHMNVPVFAGPRIVIVAGVGNKKAAYDQSDVQQLTLIMEGMWALLERKRAEEALQASERKFRVLFETMSEGIVYEDHDGKIISANSTAERLLGLSLDQMQGRTSLDPRWKAIHEDGSPFPGETHSLNVAAKTGKPATGEIMGIYNPTSGVYVWLSVNSTPEFLPGEKEPFRAYAVFRDITERKRAEEALALSEQFLSNVIEQNPESLWISDSEGTLIKMNRACRELFGITDEEAVGKYNLLKDNLIEAQGFMALVGDVFQKGEVARFTIDYDLPRVEHIQVKEGTHRILGVVISPIKDVHGKLKNVLVQHKDITEHQQAEQALLQSRRAALNMMTDAVAARDLSEQMRKALRLKNLVFDASLSANSIAGLDGVITEANEAHVQVWGFSSKDEVVGKPIPYFMNDQTEAVGIIAALNDVGHWEGDYIAKKKDGSTFIAHGLATTIKDEKGTVIGYQSAVLDVTEQREAEKELKRHRDHLEQMVAERTADLKKSEEKFRTLADFTYEWEYWIGPDRSFIYMSPSCERITGYLADEFYKNPGFMNRIIHPKDKAAFKEHVNTCHVGGRKGEPCEFEFWIIDKGGREKLIAHVCRPVMGPDGSYRGRRVSNRDITDRKHAEEELKRQSVQLEAANKELEAFSYSVSHDLKAPLRSVDGFARMLEEDYAERLDDEGRRLLQVIRDSAQDMGQLINDLLEFSRLNRKDLKTGRIGMSELVEDVRRQVEQAETGRAIRWDLGELPPAFGDEASIRVVLINLLANAVKFTRPRREAAIGISGRVEGDDVVYSVTDNGVGFDMAYKDKLFCVFQRLHATTEFEGTGIGLALVQRIVLRHGGRAWAEGKVNEGATFSFALPCRKNEKDEMRKAEEEEEETT